jgi:hypothetical protein
MVTLLRALFPGSIGLDAGGTGALPAVFSAVCGWLGAAGVVVSFAETPDAKINEKPRHTIHEHEITSRRACVTVSSSQSRVIELPTNTLV